MWVAKRLEDTCASTLGHLGGQLANNPSAPEVANTMIRNLSERDGLLHFDAAAACCEELRAVGHIPPGWRTLSTAQP